MSDLILSNLYRDVSSGFTFPTFTPVSERKLAIARASIFSGHSDDFVGIEYEIENCIKEHVIPAGNARIFGNYWDITEDGSLRNNGLEFVSKPLKGVHVANALLSLKEVLGHAYPGHKATSRCGIHVHINALDLSVTQVMAWLSVYMVFERQLFKYSGARDKNLFCLPTWAWNNNIKQAMQVFNIDERSQRTAIRTLQEYGLKYAGMNTLPLGEHGTLEFRQMGTITDFGKISMWVELLTNIKTYARSVNSVNDLKALWKKLGALNTTSEYGAFMGEVFGTSASELWYDDYEKTMAKGVVAVKELEIIHNKTVATALAAPRLDRGIGEELMRAYMRTPSVYTMIEDEVAVPEVDNRLHMASVELQSRLSVASI